MSSKVGETLIVIGEPGEEVPTEDEPRPGKQERPVPLERRPRPPRPRDPSRPPRASVKAVPKARKLARELGIDLAAVAGTGSGGSITVADVEAAAAPTAVVGGGRRERLSAIRRSIARHMTESMQIPQFTSMVDADATKLLATRAASSAETGLRVPPRCSPSGAAGAGAAGPSRHERQARRRRDRVLRALRHRAVAVDTAEGLMVPVVRGAEARSLPRAVSGDPPAGCRGARPHRGPPRARRSDRHRQQRGRPRGAGRHADAAGRAPA